MKKDSDHKIQYMPIGMCLGLSIGMAVGSAMGNISIGMCMGLGIGMCFGSALDAAKASLTGKDNVLILGPDSPLAQIFYSDGSKPANSAEMTE